MVWNKLSNPSWTIILLSFELVQVQIKYNISSDQIGSSEDEASIINIEESSVISAGGLEIEIVGLKLFNLNDKHW